LHVGNGFVVDRIQTGGAGNLNIPEEQVFELGNYQSVATVRDIPDLSFDLESLDVSTEIEALLTAQDPADIAEGDQILFTSAVPMDVISPFKSAKGQYDIIRGLAVPYLTLESATYRFGTRANATQSFTLRGDSIFYIQGAPYYEEFAAAGTGPYAMSPAALPYMDGNDTNYALSVCYVTPQGVSKRLFWGEDYTDTSGAVTLETAPPAGSTVRIVWGSLTGTEYPQSVHEGVEVKPAAVRGKDIDVYIGSTAATPTFSRWTGVQSFETTWRVTLDNDEEFGNKHYVAQDYDVPEVTGSITVRPRDVDDLWDKIFQVTDVPPTEIAGPNTSVTLPVELRVHHPDTGDQLKTLYVPDARFTPPPIQGRAQQKVEVTFGFRSDGGVLEVYRGAR
jgi:hypothetical protein